MSDNNRLEIVEFEIAKLSLKPDDILCFCFSERYSRIDVENFLYDIAKSGIVPDGVGSIFLENGIEITVIKKE